MIRVEGKTIQREFQRTGLEPKHVLGENPASHIRNPNTPATLLFAPSPPGRQTLETALAAKRLF